MRKSFFYFPAIKLNKSISENDEVAQPQAGSYSMRIGNALSEINVQELYDKNAPKKAKNLSASSNLLHKARSLEINLSAALEQALELETRKTEGEK